VPTLLPTPISASKHGVAIHDLIHLDTFLIICFAAVKTESDLLPPGAAPGTVPTDLEQATGLERLELLGKMEGIDIFDMRPLDASRLGA
jgi:hypothetical protein